jgi:molybdopterin-guanine dinucleotide biosynthesis protein A
MGRDKTRLEFNGRTLLEHAFLRFSEEFDEVYVSVGDVLCPPSIPEMRVMPDIFPGLGPISGLHAALMRFDSAFLAAADMPLTRVGDARRIIAAPPELDACAARADGMVEPTFALWRKSALPEVSAAISRGEHSLRKVLEMLKTAYVETESGTMLNINYPGDYERLIDIGGKQC